MIYETIVITVSPEGEAHITPFGIQHEDGLLLISPYRPSKTLENILATGRAVVNLTDDVRVFAAALTGREAWRLVPTELIDGYRLVDTLAHQELELVKFEDDSVRPRLQMRAVYEMNHRPFQGFNRAQAAVIELAVLVSRLKRLPMEKIQQEMQYLSIAIEKTAGAREREAWGWLTEAVNNHLAALSDDHLA